VLTLCALVDKEAVEEFLLQKEKGETVSCCGIQGFL
jgi:hypothetical protein